MQRINLFPTFRPPRESYLSYRATNLFEPGFDISYDSNQDEKSPAGVFHLANYGLSSPFPEDTLICAVSGAFWPGAVPDATRFLSPHLYPVVTPVLDDQAGWDGIPMPVQEDASSIVYLHRAYADYVRGILVGTLEYEKFAETGGGH